MINDLINRLQKCPEYSCSRCTYYGTPACAIKEAIVELKHCDQIFKWLNEKLKRTNNGRRKTSI